MPWVTVGLWLACPALVVALLLFVSSPNATRIRRGGFSVQHLLNLQSVWEPGARYVFEEKQAQREDEDDDGGPDRPGRVPGRSGRLPADRPSRSS
jgi:hypothetical protein